MSTLMVPKNMESYHSDGKDNSMSKECLQVKPRRELNFIRQRNKYVAEITLINNDYNSVIFKVRTTAAKSYVVFPTIGLIHPRATKIIQIYMPTREEVRDRANDRFLVQAFPYAGDIEEEDQNSVQEIFNLFTKSMSSQGFQNTKLRVHFEVHSAIKEVHSEDSTPAVKRQSRSTSAMRNNNDNTTHQRYRDDSYPTSFFEEVSNKSRLLSSPDPAMKASHLEQSNPPSLREIESKNVLSSSPEQVPSISANPSLEKIPKSASNNYIPNQALTGSKQALIASSEKDHSHYSSFTSNPLRLRTATGSNDISGYTDYSDFKSVRSTSDTLLMYKAKCITLEQKYKQQKKLLAQMIEEKETYLSKANSLKLSSIAGSKENQEFKNTSKSGQIELWHILVVSIIFLILGSLLK